MRFSRIGSNIDLVVGKMTTPTAQTREQRENHKKKVEERICYKPQTHGNDYRGGAHAPTPAWTKKRATYSSIGPLLRNVKLDVRLPSLFWRSEKGVEFLKTYIYISISDR